MSTAPERIDAFVKRVTEHYWQELRAAFPEATTDIPASQWEQEHLEDGLQMAAWEWVGMNTGDELDWGPVDEEDFEPEEANA